MTPIERQLGQVWGMFAVGCILTGVIVVLMGLEVTQLLPFVVLESGMAAGCMAAILGLVLRNGHDLCRARGVLGRRAERRPRGLRCGLRHRPVHPRLEALAATRCGSGWVMEREQNWCRFVFPLKKTN